MLTIEVDFEVFKALTVRRATEAVTYNDVLRELLDLPPATPGPTLSTPPGPGDADWITKDVRFPVGTEFRASYKGKIYHGKVEAGKLVVNGQRFNSPSRAAGVLTGNSVNGWTFWEARLPGRGGWLMIKSLRQPKS
jgi:hypothetical protein